MTREEYLKRLQTHLQGIPKEERDEILSEYDEHFAIGQAEGRDEAEIAESLGDPVQLAKELKAECVMQEAEERPSLINVLRALLLIGSLGFFNLVFMLGPFIAVIGVTLGLYAAVVAFIVSPLFLLFLEGIPNITAEWLNLITSLVLCVLGVWLFRKLVVMTRWMYRAVLKYVQYNRRIAKERVSHHE